MEAVGVRVEEADRNGLHAGGQEGVDRAGRLRLVERAHDLAPVVDALAHLQPPVAGNERRGLLPGEVVEARHAQAADLEDVAEALGGEEARAGALPLQDRVGGDRGAVDDLADHRRVEPLLREEPADALHDATAQVVRRRRDLRREDAALLGEEHDIGERAADIDADAEPHAGMVAPGEPKSRVSSLSRLVMSRPTVVKASSSAPTISSGVRFCAEGWARWIISDLEAPG